MDLSKSDTTRSFHQTDIQNRHERDHDLPFEIGLCLDLSSRSLKKVPLFITASNHLQFLYLQGNLLEKLTHDFFSNLPSLRHLDLRQNKLLEIPVSVAGHNSLEVLLLQDNQLSLLPYELGQVPRLRKLQFSGNPLSWPPENILSQGLGAILSFLRSAFMDQLSRGDLDDIPKANSYEDCTKGNEENLELPPRKPVLRKSMSLNENESSVLPMKSATSSSLVPRSFEEINFELESQAQIRRKSIDGLILLKGQPKQLKHKTNSTGTGSHVWSKEFRGPSLKPYVSPVHAQAIMNGQSYPLGYKKRSSPSTTKIYKTLLQKLWLNQLKCVLQSQESVLQKQRTSEALRQWRQEAKAVPKKSSQHSWSGLDLPYDFDPNYLKMVSRSGWQSSQNESLEKRGHSKPNTLTCAKAMSLQEKIDQILKSFDEIKLSKTDSYCRSGDNDPSTRCKLLAEEMKRISHLQKAVQALRLSA